MIPYLILKYFTQVFEVRGVDELTDEWMDEQLSGTYK